MFIFAQSLLYRFAQSAYGKGIYGEGNYGQGNSTTSGALSDTGMSVVIIGTIAASLIICGVILFMRARKSRRKK